ncbi:oocyte zinc finger protein XlCOF6-like isoform X2 [Homarus americanus]|uniref:oocyte zinc finger protein XlCOF6-like isoform X2 n=1 Tax=Homarus americanus TaxID=6706 RepID=UPI001C494775|nr:oocyte zinc finger protein XlCOF6-like isoform X2 [Homarus americanus]
MEGTSEGLRLWKLKLNEIVNLASHIPPGDQKVAAEFWFAALKQIQTLWSKSSPVLIDKNAVRQFLCDDSPTTAESTTFHHITAGKNVNTHNISLSLGPDTDPADAKLSKSVNREWKRSISQPQSELLDVPKRIKEENKDDDERRGYYDETNVKTVVKQEIINTQENERQEKIKKNNPNEVQSVHLMISADPVLVPNMNKFKKVYKNEITGKTETAYQCEKCPKQCRTALALYKHRSSHTKSLECPVCHQRLSNRHALNAHKRTHTGERPYECTKCSSRFTTRGNLARHIASHDGEKPWQCAICGKRYTEKKSLKIHMRTHTGEKPYACTQCPKRFSQSGILQAHMLIHTDQFSHLCDICGRSFRQRSQLITHHLRHEGVRPFACPECERRFTTKGDMERHLRTHTGERPFRCDVCGASFARPQTLQEHKNRHYNFKPYVCKICGKSFHELAACSRHVKGLHGRGKGNTPASANILRLTNADQQHDEVGKQSILITQLNVGNEGDINTHIEERENGGEGHVREENEGVEEVEEEGEIKHHIFVMHTTDSEETELITIAEPSNSLSDNNTSEGSAVSCEGCGALMSSVTVLRNHARHCKGQQGGVSVAEWLVHGRRDSPSNGMEITVGDDDRGDGDLSRVEETNGGLECVEEVDGTSLSHAVTISEDGSITSVPLSQLAPIHLQLENDYMVVLSNGTRTEEETSAAFQPQELQQVEEAPLTVSDSETSQPRITLVSSLLTQ